MLDMANKNNEPRVTRDLLDTYIDDEETDIDALFDKVLDFLEKTNATKKVVANLLAMRHEGSDHPSMKNTMM